MANEPFLMTSNAIVKKSYIITLKYSIRKCKNRMLKNECRKKIKLTHVVIKFTARKKRAAVSIDFIK